MLKSWTKGLKPIHWLYAILILGLLNGLTYVFLVPPWQHYDEPSHFEYAWLVANRPGMPKLGDYNISMRRQVAISMVEHGFYRDLIIKPNINGSPPDIGFTQLNDPPLYYLTASLPLRMMHGQEITRQMYAARLVSLCMYLLMILVGWEFMGEIVAYNHPLRWMVPLSLALLPGFVDLMTSINNDVGAVLVFSLFLWASVRLVRRGPSLFGVLFVLGAAALCYWTANVAWLALPLLPIVLVFSWLHGRWRMLVVVSLCAAFAIGFISAFTWGDASAWYRRTFQSSNTRVDNSFAPVGTHAFSLDLSTNAGNSVSIQQPLPPETLNIIINTPVTIGAWVWSDQPMSVQLPALSCDCGGQLQVFTREVQAVTEPKFYSLTVTLPANASYAWVVLASPPDQGIEKGIAYYDGLLLLQGEWSAQNPPNFTNIDGSSGTWGGIPFTNLLRNSSAEQAGPGVRRWANMLSAKIIPTWPTSLPSDIPVSLFDLKGSGWYYKETLTFMLRTFWAKFGWGNVPLLGIKPYWFLAGVTLLGMAGAAWIILKRKKSLAWDILILLGLVLLGIWAPAIFRGVGSLFGWAYTPVARYGLPAILPTLLILNAGWLKILRIPSKWWRLSPTAGYIIFVILFAVLDGLSIFSIGRFFYRG